MKLLSNTYIKLNIRGRIASIAAALLLHVTRGYPRVMPEIRYKDDVLLILMYILVQSFWSILKTEEQNENINTRFYAWWCCTRHSCSSNKKSRTEHCTGQEWIAPLNQSL